MCLYSKKKAPVVGISEGGGLRVDGGRMCKPGSKGQLRSAEVRAAKAHPTMRVALQDKAAFMRA